MNIDAQRLEFQFITDLISALDPSNGDSLGESLNEILAAIIEDIWEAPEEWPEYDEFFGTDRDPNQVRVYLLEIAKKYKIHLDETMEEFYRINKENPTGELEREIARLNNDLGPNYQP